MISTVPWVMSAPYREHLEDRDGGAQSELGQHDGRLLVLELVGRLQEELELTQDAHLLALDLGHEVLAGQRGDDQSEHGDQLGRGLCVQRLLPL